MTYNKHDVSNILFKIEQYIHTVNDILEDYDEESEILTVTDEDKIDDLKFFPEAISKYIDELRSMLI